MFSPFLAIVDAPPSCDQFSDGCFSSIRFPARCFLFGPRFFHVKMTTNLYLSYEYRFFPLAFFEFCPRFSVDNHSNRAILEKANELSRKISLS